MADNHIDSLKFVLLNSKDIHKAAIYNNLAESYDMLPNDECIAYAEKAMILAKKNSQYDEEAKAYYLLAVLNRENDDYTLAVNYAQKAFNLFEKIGFKIEKANSLVVIGACKYFMGNYDESLELYQRALHIYEEEGDISQAANVLNNIANVFQNWKNYEKSLEYFKKSAELYIQAKDSSGLSAIHNNIANVYFELQDYDKTIQYNLMSLRIKEQIKDSVGIGLSYNNIANVYFKKNDYNKALKNYKEALSIFQKHNDLNNTAMAHNNLGFTYENMNNLEKALFHYNKGYKIGLKIKSVEKVLFALESFAEVSKAQGNYKQACEYYRTFIDKKDSIFSEKQQETIHELQIKFETAKKEKEFAIVKKEKEQVELENDKNEQIVKNQTLLIITFILATLIILVILRMLYKQIQKKNYINSELSMKNEEILQQKEELLAQSEKLSNTNTELEKLSVVARETNNLIVICDLDGKIEWANQAFYGSVNREFENIKQLNQKIFRKFEACVNEKKSDTFTSSIETYDTNPIWIQMAITPILDEENNISQIVTVSSDVSYIKKAEQEIQEQQKELVKAFKQSSKQQVQLHKAMIQIDEQKKEITDSIHYARRIQNAVLPPFDFFEKFFKSHFIYYQPKDIVSGDFFWGQYFEEKKIMAFAVADCTGHGVPGAFMSMLGISFLDEIASAEKSPSEILDELREAIIKALHQTGKNDEAKDGMDISFCMLNTETNELFFAGANNPLYIVKNEENTKLDELSTFNFQLDEVKADKMPIGIHFGEIKPFTTRKVLLSNGDIIYLFSDGYADQFGGKNGKKFKYNQFKELLLNNCQLPMNEQKDIINHTFAEWKGENPQIDDVCILGIRI